MSRPDQPEAVPTALNRPVPRHRHQDPSTLIPSQDWFGHLAIQREPATDDILGVIGTTFLLRPRQQAPDQLVLTDLQIQSDVSSQVKLDGHPVDRPSLLHRARQPELKNVAKLPATAVATKMAHASRPTSTILPTVVGGFVILEETVSNCTEQKKAASPSPWIFPPFCPPSNTHMSTVATAKTTVDSPNASTKRANSPMALP